MDERIRPALRDLEFSPTLRLNEQVARMRAEGQVIYHMGFGESPFPVHPVIQESISGFSGENAYMPAAGLTELREKAKWYIIRKHRIPEEAEYLTMIGPGSKELIFDIQLAVGGDLLFPVPSWVSYIPQTYITQDEVVKIYLPPGESYKLSAGRLSRRIDRAREEGYNPTKLILNYPNNPTGLSYTPEELKQIAAVCRRERLLVISDEIYAQVSFRDHHTSIAAFYPEGTIVTTGLSKHLSLGGFRLGVALVPVELEEIFRVLRSIASETFSAVSTPIQYSVLAAFERNPEIEAYIEDCTEIHAIVTRYVWKTVLDLGLEYSEPDGGFYLYPDFEPYRGNLRDHYGIETSDDLAEVLLRENRVASLPGTAFGDEPEALRLRLSTVDFDGMTALRHFHEHGAENEEEFVKLACPRVAEGCRQFVRFFQGDTT
ncbi:MAG: pyridoxal phosphate-dependent aminotransferase [Spirochaetaceae bacterium]